MSSKQVLKDKLGRSIGSIETDGRGVQTIKDKLGRKQGAYDPNSNITKDKLGRKVGTGNLLTTLLPPM